ncbi:MAG: hypothetical protein RL077_5362 [Verrucomicrobiota bacterium]|jgi:hypothetical protein
MNGILGGRKKAPGFGRGLVGKRSRETRKRLLFRRHRGSGGRASLDVEQLHFKDQR